MGLLVVGFLGFRVSEFGFGLDFILMVGWVLRGGLGSVGWVNRWVRLRLWCLENLGFGLFG